MRLQDSVDYGRGRSEAGLAHDEKGRGAEGARVKRPKSKAKKVFTGDGEGRATAIKLSFQP